METGAKLVVKTVAAIRDNTYNETPQSISTDLKAAPKIFKDFCKINWNQPTDQIYNHIRGLSPYPTAFTVFQDKLLKVFEVKPEYIQHSAKPGDFLSDGKTYLKVATTNGYINLLDVQYEGKKRMRIDKFLRGIRLN